MHTDGHGCYNYAMLIERIPQDLLAKYRRHELSSSALAKVIGCHPQSLRRAIERPKKVKQPTNKTALLEARQKFRLSIGHLSVSEIADRASVSTSTARRIKQKWNDLNA